jgi:hypothetical protein
MAVVYADGIKTTRMQAVLDAIDAGSGNGTLEICTAGYGAVLAVVPLSDPSGVVSGDTLTLNTPIQDNSIDQSGTAALARVKDSDGNIVISGLTVGTSGTDIIVGTTSLVATQVFRITSATLTHG